MPAEWEPHAATWLSWPHKEASWPGKFAPIPKVFARLARTLARNETVNILAGDGASADAYKHVGNVPNVEIHVVETDDAWIRDSGPTFLVGPADQPPAVVNWGYNAWGGKYPPFEQDDRIPSEIAAITRRKIFTPRMILEGGAIDVNGRGTLLTTEQCLLNKNRNPKLDKPAIEKYLRDYLNVSNILWLKEGIVGDDTDGHIDELARFVNPTTIVAAVESDDSDENYAVLQKNLADLRAMTDQDGKPFTVVALPMPRPLFYDDQRMPGSYTNFYIANGTVVVPQFGDPADWDVLDILRPLFPGREVVGLPARDLAWGLGAFHCVTQQEPR
ncbi:MAG: agmatine deiminase family protein [Pirellulales bacterium]